MRISTFIATELLKLGFGAVFYNCHDQNIYIDYYSTETKNPEEIKRLIYFPNGKPC